MHFVPLTFVLTIGLGAAQPPTKPDAPAPTPAGSAQEPETQDPYRAEREALIASLRAAHQVDADRSFDHFEADLRITRIREREDNIEVGVRATFLKPRYIREQFVEGSGRTERGWDENGPWARNERYGVFQLAGRDHASERSDLRQHVRLSRQMLEYLDPARTFAKLEITEPPRNRELVVSRRLKIPCRTFKGSVATFPLYEGLKDRERVELEVWIDKKTGLLTAVRATPLDAKNRPLTEGELVLLRDYRSTDDVLLPTSLTVFSYTKGQREPSLQVTISAIDLHTPQTLKSLARPE